MYGLYLHLLIKALKNLSSRFKSVPERYNMLPYGATDILIPLIQLSPISFLKIL